MRLTFDPMTIEHLGFKMYSHLPNAVAELVANAYDADATRVEVRAVNDADSRIIVSDDGHGMSARDLQEKYLRIGRNRVRSDGEHSESGRRRVAGKKGLGKLALFGIGEQITVKTTRTGQDSLTSIFLDWTAMLDSAGDYEPRTVTSTTEPASHGTSVEIRSLKRKTPVEATPLAKSLSRLFGYADEDFTIEVLAHGTSEAVTRELRYDAMTKESTWRVPDNFDDRLTAGWGHDVTGEIYASEKPLPQDLRGVTLYVNGRLANDPEYFGVPESSYAYSYLTGYLDVDFLDDLPEDIISTDRRSISWDVPETARLREYLEKLLRDVAQKRRDARGRAKRERLRKDLNVDKAGWTGSIKGRAESEAVGDVLDVITSADSEMSDEDRGELVDGLRRIAPEHADFHWRHVHSSLQEACKEEYKHGNYLAAIQEAVKRYVKDARGFSGIKGEEASVISGSFGGSTPRLVGARGWRQLEMSDKTLKNIREAQHKLSEGLWSGFRNPLSHEERVLLVGEGVFTYQDCLDALSLLSHLRRRLDSFETDRDVES